MPILFEKIKAGQRLFVKTSTGKKFSANCVFVKADAEPGDEAVAVIHDGHQWNFDVALTLVSGGDCEGAEIYDPEDDDFDDELPPAQCNRDGEECTSCQ